MALLLNERGLVLATQKKALTRSLKLLTPENALIRYHPSIETLFLLNPKSLWMLELISPLNLRTLEIGARILEKREEMSQIYAKIPESSSILIGDKTFHLACSESLIVVYSLHIPTIQPLIEKFARLFLDQPIYEKEWLTKLERIKLALQFMEQTQLIASDIPPLKKLMFDDLLCSKIVVKYPDHIPRIIDRLSKEFSIGKSVLHSLLVERSTLLDLLKNDYLPRARELIELVEYVNRRKIIQ